jgi:hypothetical protein
MRREDSMTPRSINILGREYLVRRKRMKDYGSCDFGSGTIWIRSGLKPEGDSGSDATLLHEAIHAILHEAGLHYNWTTDFSESVVRALEHGLWRAGFRLEGK